MTGFDEGTMAAAHAAVDDRNAAKFHVLRAKLPWRDDKGTTECGRDASTVDALTREEAVARYKEWGQRRTNLLICMTCRDHTYAWMTWEQSPVAVVARECNRGAGRFGGTWGRTDEADERPRLDYELRALGLLVDAHREEFNATLLGLTNTVDLAQRRRGQER